MVGHTLSGALASPDLPPCCSVARGQFSMSKGEPIVSYGPPESRPASVGGMTEIEIDAAEVSANRGKGSGRLKVTELAIGDELLTFVSVIRESGDASVLDALVTLTASQRAQLARLLGGPRCRCPTSSPQVRRHRRP